MFRAIKSPQEPRYDAELTALGFKYESGQFVATSDSHTHFEFYHTDSDRANEQRNEAMREAVRQVVFCELSKYNIHEVYLGGAQGTTVMATRPHAPHVSILSTQVSALKEKKDVIIVIGEAAAGSQDAGIFAYRIALREGGPEQGTAVGMAARLAAYGQVRRTDDMVEELGGLTINGFKEEDHTPGLIILNPGQVLYSCLRNRPMTQKSWTARSRTTAIVGPFEVDDTYNTVPGHRTAANHIYTFLEHILSSMISDKARVYMATIGDTANDVVQYLDQLFLNKTEFGLGRQLESLAIIQGNHDPDEIVSDPLKIFLATHGRCWIESPVLPKGRLVQTPRLGKNVVNLEDFPFLPPDKTLDEELSAAECKNTEKGQGADENEKDPDKLFDGEDEQIAASGGAIGEQQDTFSLTETNSMAETVNLEDVEFVDVEDEANAHHRNDIVCCPTFSAGECNGIVESVFPKVMGDVLRFFFNEKEMAEGYYP